MATDDDYGDDIDFTPAIAASERRAPAAQNGSTATALSDPTRSNAAATTSQGQHGDRPKVQQPKPQALAQPSTSSILVSTRQKGNPLLKFIKSAAWEYSDIPADYVLGQTTCAFFLSIKYHRLHPEYIYNRIRQLQGRYQLRVLLVLVDVDDHEEPLRELSKTSLINNVTVMLCWSAAEAARYVELYKVYEHAAAAATSSSAAGGSSAAIRGRRAERYEEQMVAFVTTPRSINKTDAVGLMSNFGSLRTAINAPPEEIALVAGWGEKKVKRWCGAVNEPFRRQRAAKRELARDNTTASLSRDVSSADVADDDAIAMRLGESISAGSARVASSTAPRTADGDGRGTGTSADDAAPLDPGEDLAGEAAFAEAEAEAAALSRRPAPAAPVAKRASEDAADDGLSESVRAALAKLRNQG